MIMNFKPTLIKIFISLIAAILFFNWYNSKLLCDKGSCIDPASWVISILLAIIIYSIWSLIQNKNSNI